MTVLMAEKNKENWKERGQYWDNDGDIWERRTNQDIDILYFELSSNEMGFSKRKIMKKMLIRFDEWEKDWNRWKKSMDEGN